MSSTVPPVSVLRALARILLTQTQTNKKPRCGSDTEERGDRSVAFHDTEK